MNKILFYWILSIGGMVVTCSTGKPKVLNVYHWSGCLPNNIVQQFTKETGIQVNSTSYDSNEALYTKLKAMPHHNYDVIMPSSYAAHRMIQEEMLQPLQWSQLDFKSQLDTRFLGKLYDPTNQYTVPYLFSATGLVANQADEKAILLKNWQNMWDKTFKNRLLVLDDLRELFSVALLVLGFSPNTKDPVEIKKAYQVLLHLLGNIRTFNSEGMMDLYATEELTVGMGWSGDIYRAYQINRNIQFIYPKEGYMLSIDNLAIPKGAKHVKEAYQFICFLLRPEISASISEQTGYGAVNINAHDYLPADVSSNSMVYPDASTLKRGIVQLSVGEQSQLYGKYWEQIKMSA